MKYWQEPGFLLLLIDFVKDQIKNQAGGEWRRGREASAPPLPRQEAPRLRNPQAQKAMERQKTGESVKREAWTSGVGGAAVSTPCSQRQVTGKLSAPGQNCVKVAGLSGKLRSHWLTALQGKRKKVKGNLQAGQCFHPLRPLPRRPGLARRPEARPRCAPVHTPHQQLLSSSGGPAPGEPSSLTQV